MMLQVEAYAMGSKAPIAPPLHICLATAESKTGTCLTVGRKEGVVQFPEDKTVSRCDHCILRFVSTATESAFPCRTPEESDGVDSLHHMAVVIENRGTYGSLLVQDPDRDDEKLVGEKEKKSSKDDDDSATVDSAEAGREVPDSFAHTSQGSLLSRGLNLSWISQQIFGGAGAVKKEWLGPNQSRVLLSLRRPKGRVIIQCGNNGSTLVISRLETIFFVKSGIAHRSKLPWLDRLDWIGAHEIDDWSLAKDKDHDINSESQLEQRPAVSLLVTPKRDPSAKQLAAWSQGIPVVTPNYMEALLARTNPADPLPDVKDYEPPQLTSGNNSRFWKSITPDPYLLKGSTFLSVKEGDELELLVAAAGADVWKLYELEAPEQELELISSSRAEGFFGLNQPRRKLTDVLKKRGIPLVAAKAIAQAITEQDPALLHPKIAVFVARSKESPLGRKTSRDADARGPTIVTTTGQDAVGRPTDKIAILPIQENQILDTTNKGEKELHSFQDSKQVKESGPLDVDVDVAVSKKTCDMDDVARSAKTDSRKVDLPVLDDNAPGKKVDKAPPRRGGVDASLPIKKLEDTGAKSSSQPLAPLASETTQKKTTTQGAGGQSDLKRKEVTNAPSQLSKRSRKDGWFEVAPKNDAQRLAQVRSDEEISKISGYEVILPRAKTIRVSGMITKPSTVPPPKVSSRIDSRLDFRGFRKNRVHQKWKNPMTQNKKKMMTTMYHLVVHRPKVSATQSYELEEQQERALEEQQRRTENLFRDANERTAAGRRR